MRLLNKVWWNWTWNTANKLHTATLRTKSIIGSLNIDSRNVIDSVNDKVITIL